MRWGVLLGLALLLVTTEALIMCNQLWKKPFCERDSPRCKWFESKICNKQKQCQTIEHGCHDRDFCGFVFKADCRQFKHCRWSKNKCKVRKCARIPNKETTSIWKCSNLAWPFAMDGECDDCGPGSVSCWAMYGADCSDCGIRD